MSWLKRLFGQKDEAVVVDKPVKPINKTIKFTAPAAGELIALEKVSDPIFAQKLLGEGFAIIPTDGKLVAPIAGEVITVMATRHAFAFEADNGLQVLVHLGIDTVELNGRPFTLNINDGKHVEAGQEIGHIDLDQLKESGKDPAIMVVVTNMDKVANVGKLDYKPVIAGERIWQVTVK